LAQPFFVFSGIPIDRATKFSPITNDRIPVKFSSWVKVVPPGVLVLGLKKKAWSPTKIPEYPPFQAKRVGEFSYKMNQTCEFQV
jgi:hypothetical protein